MAWSTNKPHHQSYLTLPSRYKSSQNHHQHQ
ncbi:hypothetical protein CTAM01_08925 [Colletotrichum tamarilloi]|uniref:Uncharacterized protein n=1 Tax=Colletotrichum tamarilloi TaxID=1209934 RepID=A0ABQ9R4R9_9PEZI|nr:uncharacterized protein CTAM01_08925 [Colletotrichum tamarilloi]KAK1494571.1 hypothetical protein CTAM01_08925 [Colletotrichum tamarilloi]